MEALKVGQETDLKKQVKSALNDYIQSMDLSKNNKLPSEAKLSVMLGVSRVTLRSVLKEMEMEGTVFSRHGSGTYVNTMARKIVYNFAVPELYEKVIQGGGARPSIKLEGIFFQPADERAASDLRIAPGTELVAVRKTFYADSRFAMHCIDYFPREDLTKEQIQSFSNVEFSTFDYLYQYKGRKAMWDSTQIRTISNREFPELNGPAMLKEGEWKPFLFVRAINYDKTDTPFIYSHTFVDTDVIEYKMIRKKSYKYEAIF